MTLAKKQRPFTRKQSHAKRLRAAQTKKKRTMSSKQLYKMMRQGRYVDEMTKGCEGWS